MLAFSRTAAMHRLRMLLLTAALAVTPWLQPVGDAQQPPAARSPRNASYLLRAELDPETRTITGSGLLTWRNISAIPATELQFHLYWNAWRNSGSSWMREQRRGRNAGLADRPEADWGWIDLSALRLVSGEGNVDLLRTARFIAPDDGNPDDRTVLAVPLETPVEPGATVTIDLAWQARVPRTFSRTGTIGDYFFVAHWFPKIGVLEDTGWNCHQFHAATEFFADFGTYDVSLTVPTGWIVGATGREESRTDQIDGTTTHQYVQADVHDFAWTTSPDFVERIEPFQYPGLPTVTMRLLLQPEHVDQADRHFAATRAALSLYGSWFGPYPYPQITIVDPVPIFNPGAQGGSTGGMEYPTLFTAGTRWSAPRSGTQPESVTVHEAGHQFWYGIVATNEFEHAWLDEGLNTFSTARVLDEGIAQRFVAVERYFGGLLAWPYADVGWTRAVDGNRLNAFRPAATVEVQATPTWQYWPGTASATSYNRTALWLATLERHLGWPTVRRILATHFARGAYGHPTPDDFFAIANEVSGQDLAWFFDQVHRGSVAFDYGIDQVSSAPAGPRGRIGQGAAARFSEGDVIERDHLVVVRRYGDGVFPLDVRIRFDDGATVTETWDGRSRWQAFEYRRAGRVATVEVDPDRVLLLDLDYTNNSWTADPRAGEAGWKWTLRWLTWLEEVLLTYAFFA